MRLNAWPDKPEALVRTMTLALDDAGVAATDVDVVYASANATQALDAAEAAALTTLFGGSRTVITSIKGALGESGVAGATSCAAALLCGRAGRIPPIAGLATPDDGDVPADAGHDSARGAWADCPRQQLRERRRAVQRRAPDRDRNLDGACTRAS